MVAIIKKFGPPTFFKKFMNTSINNCLILVDTLKKLYQTHSIENEMRKNVHVPKTRNLVKDNQVLYMHIIMNMNPTLLLVQFKYNT